MAVTLLPLLLVGAGLGALVCTAMSSAALGWSEEQHRSGGPGASSLAFTVLCAGSMAVVLASKLATLERFAVDLPFWDQWEEAPIYTAFHQGKLTWGVLLSAHNEHRIFVSRVLALALEVFNGQWDNRLQAVACALIHALQATTMLLLLSRSRRSLETLALAIVVVGAIAAPVARENVVWGFQSQFYLYILFSLLGLGLLSEARPLSGAWWTGHACVACTVLCLGSGIVTAAVAVLVMASRVAIRGARRDPSPILQLMPSLAIVGVAALVMVRPAAGVVWQPRSVGEFLVAFGRSASFPWVDHPWSAAVMWTPFVVAGWRWVRAARSGSDRDGLPVFLGLGAWVLANAAAIAMARGVGGARPSSRYMDILATGVVVNASVLLGWHDGPWPRTLLRRALVACWLALAAAGTWGITKLHLGEEMPAAYTMSLHQIANLRAFLASGQRSVLQGRAFLEIPYPSPEYIAEQLDDPFVRGILPASLRGQSDRGPWSRAAETLIRCWRSILAGGAGAMLAAALIARNVTRRRARGAVRRAEIAR